MNVEVNYNYYIASGNLYRIMCDENGNLGKIVESYQSNNKHWRLEDGTIKQFFNRETRKRITKAEAEEVIGDCNSCRKYYEFIKDMLFKGEIETTEEDIRDILFYSYVQYAIEYEKPLFKENLYVGEFGFTETEIVKPKSNIVCSHFIPFEEQFMITTCANVITGQKREAIKNKIKEGLWKDLEKGTFVSFDLIYNYYSKLENLFNLFNFNSKENEYNYYLYLDSVLFRIPRGEDGADATCVGEIFNPQERIWLYNVETMRMRMSGEYSELTVEKAMDIVNF